MDQDDGGEYGQGGGDRSSLWILSRDKNLPAERRDALVKAASDWGFDVSELEYPE